MRLIKKEKDIFELKIITIDDLYNLSKILIHHSQSLNYFSVS
jgi:hypothetical protein